MALFSQFRFPGRQAGEQTIFLPPLQFASARDMERRPEDFHCAASKSDYAGARFDARNALSGSRATRPPLTALS